ncbi:MAG: epoxyqueuosine reductase QueH [Clostridiales bacterium]|nr:epoxyqueuosine reductase QueH [Clostridiales bacterium]
MNYNILMKEKINSLKGKKSLLLHSCCGPCSTAVIERLKPFFDITVFFYNPNIFDKEEYEKRLTEQKKVCDFFKVNLLVGEYDDFNFFSLVKGKEEDKEGGERCHVCYKFRLEKTLEKLKELNFDYFTTTLTVSPMKNSEVINEMGSSLSEKYLPSDFKKENGYLRSIKLSKELGLYRQNFCGCVYSKD